MAPQNNTDQSSPKRCLVSFSEMTQVVTVEPPAPPDAENIWHSKQDKALFKRALVNDVRRISSRLSDTPRDSVPQDELYECLGLECLLSPELLARSVEGRRLHTDAILSEQAHQRVFANDDEEDDGSYLSYMSAVSSKPTRERAHQLAVGYWNFMD